MAKLSGGKLGWVYVLSNPSIDGLIKIGMSENDPSHRSEELHTTGVPEPFHVEYKALVENQARVEKAVHDALGNFRHKPNREFFGCSVSTAVEAIKKHAEVKFEEADFKDLVDPSLDKKRLDANASAESLKKSAAAIRITVDRAKAREKKNKLDQENKSERALWLGLIIPVGAVLLLQNLDIGAWALTPLVAIPYFLFLQMQEYEVQYTDQEAFLIAALDSSYLNDEELVAVAHSKNPEQTLEEIKKKHLMALDMPNF